MSKKYYIDGVVYNETLVRKNYVNGVVVNENFVVTHFPLDIDEARHVHTVDTVNDLNYGFTLEIQECRHLHVADNCTIVGSESLTIQECSHAHSVFPPTISQVSLVTPCDLILNKIDFTTVVNTLDVTATTNTMTIDL